MKHVVATIDEIPPGTRKIVTVAGRSIGIFNVHGELFAVRNVCPHQGASLCLGDLYGSLESSSPGEYRYDAADVVLRCPWHGWEFDLRTGRSWWNPEGTRVRRYEVLIDAGADSPARRDGRLPGPYTAETYPVTVQGAARILIEL